MSREQRPENAEKIICEKTGEHLAYIIPDVRYEDIWDIYFFTYNNYTSGPFGFSNSIFEIPDDKYITGIDYHDDVEKRTHTHRITLGDYKRG